MRDRLALVLALAAPAAAHSQPVPVHEHPAVRAALTALRTGNSWTVQQQIGLCEIPAPPFGEAARAAEYRRRFEALGLTNVRLDGVGNVIAERPGLGHGPRVVLSAHLDTVFPDTVDVTVRVEDGRLHGPGIGDDCRGLAVVLAVARALRDANVRTAGTIVFVGTVGEEGEGNLRGVRHLFDRQTAGPVQYFISVDGVGLSATTRAVGSHRYRVRIEGPGGHSYADFGIPNPIHALGRAIARIAALPVPASPRTTFNVGVIEGGTSVNSIPAAAAMLVDLRSESQLALDSLDAAFRRAVAVGVEEEIQRWPGARQRLRFDLVEIGRRPAAAMADTAFIVRATVQAAQALGFTPALTSGSTDANYPMSLGIPSVTIDGGGRGGGAHTTSEWYEDIEGWKGPQWAMLLVLMLAGVAER
jgi:acetylornithine deacetylase/succinyl-diaminopimelate desuccinylase-like protein